MYEGARNKGESTSTTCLNNQKKTFCPKRVFVYKSTILKIKSDYFPKQLIMLSFVMEKQCVLCAALLC
jgi:hypothetical protein